MRTIPATLFAVLLMSGAALAEETAPPTAAPPPPPEATTPPAPPAPPPETQASNEEDQKIVCKKLDPPTGSRMGGKKVCRTVADWRRITEVAKDTVQEIQTKDSRGPAGN